MQPIQHNSLFCIVSQCKLAGRRNRGRFYQEDMISLLSRWVWIDYDKIVIGSSMVVNDSDRYIEVLHFIFILNEICKTPKIKSFVRVTKRWHVALYIFYPNFAYTWPSQMRLRKQNGYKVRHDTKTFTWK
jgi:hypothetical protein